MKLKKRLQRLTASILAAAMILSGMQIPGGSAFTSKAAGKLINIAADTEIKVLSGTSQNPTDNMVDGNPDTLWVQNGGFPGKVELKLNDNTKPVKKVVIKFEKGHPEWGVDVALKHAVNNVTSDPVPDDEQTVKSFDDTYEYVYPAAQGMTHLYVELSNPKNNGAQGGFWPAIAEIEIWAQDKQEETATVNVAPTAKITSVGGDYNSGQKGNLVDEDYDTGYGYVNGNMDSLGGNPAWIEMELDREYPVVSMEAAFEKLDPDANGFKFIFDVLGKSKDDTEWQMLFENAEATRLEGGNIKELVLESKKNLKSVRFELKEIQKTGGNPWPSIREFKIFADNAGGSEEADTESIAYKKPIHTNTKQEFASRINDGSLTNLWSGERYPAYIDIDLEANYNLDEIQVYTPSAGYSQYSIYTSMDGRDFDKLVEKTSKVSCPAEGEKYKADGKEARIVRLYVEYQSESEKSLVNEIRVLGKPSGTPVQETPTVEIENFEDSEYNVKVTAEDTIDEVKGIIERRLGAEYIDWFTFELKDGANGYDYFDLTDKDGKIHITGNDGVSLATGLNHYLKYFCQVNISQVGDQVKMPENIVPVTKKVHKETKFPVRYSYNYCTLSYSMAFWGEKEWRNELDWLALNGVNVVLDATAQEEVWRRFLGELGYTHQEAKDFIAGPAYYAWAYMANLTGFGGPVHDSWFVERTELARKNQLSMRKLGMQPVLQGYCGMVPVDIKEKDPQADVIVQGNWCAFKRPDMLKTDGTSFGKYAQLFYKAQKEVYGDVSDYYATDPFHEGGNTGGMQPATISRIVMNEMLKADKDAVWIIQSWQGNPTTGLLQGLEGNRDHALVLDLYAEKTPHWNEKDPGAYGGAPGGGQFLNTPWVYCMLNNFGGRLGLHGHIENFVNQIPYASKNADKMAGIGITPEASVNNPVLYDLFFETIWTEDADNLQPINLDTWFEDYTTRRYGAESENAYEAMKILNDTVYKPELNMDGQGAPESVINARPKLDIGAASTWGNAVVRYDKEKLEQAAELLLEDYDLLKDSAGYKYDLANVLEQVLSNTAQEYQKKMSAAFNAGNEEQFKVMSDKFLEIVAMVERVTGTQKDFMLGTWVEAAKDLAKNADDFTKELYELNAKALITTWGSYDQAITGGLLDYSNRQWSGLTKDYYQMRWEKWIAERTKELAGESFKNYSAQEWFEMEWGWARGNDEYPTTPNGEDLQALGTTILADYTVGSIPKAPAENDEFDLPLDGMTASAGSAQSGQPNEGPATLVLDNNPGTIWHSLWAGDVRDNLWIDIALGESRTVNGLRMLPRTNGGNGIITKYRIEVSKDNGATYEEVKTGDWARNGEWKIAQFEAVEATNVRLIAVESSSDQADKNFASAAEIRITAPKEEEKVPADYTKLDEAIAKADAVVKANYTPDSLEKLNAAAKEGKALSRDLDSTQQSQIDEVVQKIEDAISKLVKKNYHVVTVDCVTDKTGDYNYNAKLEVTAAEEKDGNKFVGWQVKAGDDTEAIMVSANTSYSFFVGSDLKVTAVYDETAQVEPKAYLQDITAAQRADGKYDIRYLAQLVVPNGSGKLKEAGLVWSNKKDADAAAEAVMTFKFETPDETPLTTVKVTNISKISTTYQFSVTIKGVPANYKVPGKIFFELDNSGAANYYYSNVGTGDTTE